MAVTYTAIPDTDIDGESIVPQNLMTLIRDNPIAITEGASGAPRVQLAGLETKVKPWVLIEEIDASNDATIDFTGLDAYSALYDDFMLIMAKVKPINDGNAIRMRVGTGATPTWETGSDYGYHVNSAESGSVSYAANANSNANYIFLNLDVGNDSSQGMGGVVKVMNLHDAIYKTPFLIHTSSQAALNETQLGVGVGSFNVGTAITALRIYAASSNVDEGNFKLYGIRA